MKGGDFIKKKYVLLIITILWIGFIYYMSGQSAVESSEKSSKVVNFISIRFNTTDVQEEALTVIVRKGAHLTEYFILSYLITVTYLAYKGRVNDFSFILLMCILVAISDEFLQGYINGRSSEVRDVIIDFSGSLTFIISYYIFNYKNRKINGVLKSKS
ncbi:MAG: VanZ family protein [Clostridium sp.]|uniref:VanZ family protein n=1 Tax=Clostridium sp. TaxID=1506 RepID=UPI00306F55D8